VFGWPAGVGRLRLDCVW